MNKPKIDELQTLTAPQLEMWFAQQLEPQNPLFDSRAYVDIRGTIDPQVFEQALHRFIMDAQALHFHFVETSKGPMQLLGEPVTPALRFMDVSREADPFMTCSNVMQAEASKLYDLLDGPLFSHLLFKLGDEHYVWYQRYHHIVMDGASVSIAIDRVAQIYTALMRRQPVPAANFGSIEPMLQGDPAYQNSQRYANDRLYWNDYVATLPAAETVSGAPADSSGFFRRTSALLPVALGDKLTALEAQIGNKWPQVLTAIVAAYLFRVSNGRITVFDFPVAARTKETRALPGTFANVLPLRLHMTGEQTLAELTQHANTEIFKHLKHQQFRVKEIKQMWGRAAGPIFGPRINVIPFENGWTFDGGESSIQSLANGLVNDFAVTVNGIPGHPACTLFVDGNAKLYDDASVELHKKRLLHFIEAALTDPWRPIGKIDLLGADERRLLIETWNATDAPYPEHLCIHELVEAQAQRTPEATALISGDGRLSYAELNAQANRLARHLLDLGITPEARVAVCLERSPAMIVALLAILKAGGAYVPLDPAYPSARLAHILLDAAPSVVFVDQAGRHALGELLSQRNEAPSTFTLIELDFDAHASAWAAQPAGNIGPHTLRLTSQHLAYVIYTSGSTGTPKGVMVEHRQLANLVTWHIARFHLRPGCQVPSAAGLAFDACTWEIWPTLTSGATLLLAPTDCALDATALLQWWRSQSMETAFLVTPLALLAMDASLPNGLRHLLIGGDRVTNLPAGLPPSVQIVNNYGPTETTVVATSGVITPGEAVHTIGKPIANTRLYLLDEHHAPVPIGAVGELYIGGAGVARGYLNRPELTAQRFLPDPFARAAGSGNADANANADARMYRTGDLARYLPDGNLLFLGRNDDQVKIRGFRIELGEIEAQLAMHEAVREAVVVARHDAGGQPRLLAYVTVREDACTSEPDTHAELAQHLRAHLAERLPDYMLPAAFIVLDAMPLTANGKLDRRALPEPDDQAFAQTHTQYEAPQGDLETALATLWGELLTLDRVGRHDNFFSLGGHSLLAVQLIERLRRMGLALAIRDLFEHPGLAALARTLVKSADVVIPANRIEHDTTTLTPALLPLIELPQADIDRIVACVPEGVANVQDIYALSPLQDGILFHHAISTDGDPYLLSAHLAFRDRTAIDRYLEAVQRVVERHDILRTAVVWEDIGTPAQVVWRHARVHVAELALDELISPVTHQLHGRFDPQRYRMDLTQAPLLHFAIAPAPDGRWHALMLLHHLVGDHTTLEILHEEVQAIENGQEHVLPKPQPYRNLVAQARLGMPAQAHETFFRSMLDDIDTPTLPYGLTVDHRGAAQVHEAQRRLPPTLHARLLAHARSAGVSLATLCHLAWALVLARTSGQQHVVFGTVLFGRMEAGAGADRAMGLYINTLPLRVDVDATDVPTAVRETQMRLAALLAHEHASLALAQRCSGVGISESLFSALLNYRHNAPVSQAGNAPQLFGVELLAAHERTNYPLTLSVEDYGDALALTAQVVEPIDPHRICAYMQCALEQLADALDLMGTETGAEAVTLEHLRVVPDDERALLLETWNATDAPYPEHECLHQLVEAQVERTPNGTAVISGDEHLSYAELNARANRLARHLIGLSVAPDARVAVCLERSSAMVVALLAVLKAGGAYVPLDPAYPNARLAHIVTDAAPAVVLVDQRGRQALCESVGDDRFGQFTVVDVDTDPAAGPWARQPASNLDPHALGLTSRHLAYVIYTSGSTGMPKGAQNEHRALINRLTWMQATYGLDTHDVVLQKTPFSFDVSVWEFFWTLAYGATLVMAEPGAHRDADYLTDIVQRHQVTTLHFVPSMLSGFLDAPGVHRCSSLVRIVCSGEALPAATARRCQALLPQAQLHNLYGPTEAAIDVTAWTCPVGFDGDVVPIGKPIANTRLYVLDEHHAPVPIGAVGELYIGGVGVARGYLNRPELTAQRFLPDPFARDAGSGNADADADARMYRTGDLARYLPDGNLLFLGRNDDQVKIRGFRIELGEIEAQLATYDAVREAVVTARHDASGEARLLAYITVREDKRTRVPDVDLAQHLRAHLAERLPEYMLPAAFVVLDAMPLTANGKLDRRALPEPDDQAFAQAQYEAPQGALERVIAQIWESLLGLAHVGRHAHFFELGGHSILAVRMVSRLRTETGKALQLRKVFEAPTVAELAVALEDAPSPESGHDMVRVDRHSAMPLSFAEARVLAIEADDARAAMLNSSRLFIVTGRLNPDLFEQALRAVVERHEILRTHYVRDDATGSFAPVIDPAERLRLVRRHVPMHDAIDLAQTEAATLSDCLHGPVFGASLWIESPARAILVIAIHHIAMDAASWNVVWRDFTHAYAALAANEAPNLTPVPLQYRDYAAWERQHLSAERLSQLRQSWRERLAGAPVCLDLPFDRPRPPVISERGGRTERMLDAELVRGMRQVAASHHVTPFLVLETILALLCTQLAHSREVVIGTVAEGRRHEAAEEMVGLFVNTIALRHKVDRTASLSSHLLAASQELVSALEVSELPFADIVAAVNPPRASSHDPIFQVFCQFQHGFGEMRTTVADVTLEAVAREHVGRGAELAFVFQEVGERVRADITYSADLFDPASAEAIVDLYLALLDEGLRRPNLSVAELWAAGLKQVRAGASGADIARLIDPPVNQPGTWYALSSAQQAVWLQEQTAPRGTSFFAVAVMRCSSSLDRARLAAAARALMTQCQSAWLQFADTGLQREATAPAVRFEHIVMHASATEEEERRAVLAWHHERDERAGDRTGQVGVFEWPNRVLVALRSHHLQNDGWSALRSFERLAKNYAALEKDAAHRFETDRLFLDTLPLEERYLCSSTYERDAAFWQSACSQMDGPALVTLVADRPHATHVPPVVLSTRRTLPAVLQVRLADAAQTLSLSQAECLTALTAHYLSRLTGENRTVVGISFLNRAREALDIPGQFAQVIPLHVSFDEDEPLSTALHGIRDDFRDVLRHGRFPYGEMVRRFGLDRRHTQVSVNTLFLRHPVEIAGQPAQVQWLSGPESGLSFLFTQFGRNAPIEVELRFNGALFDPVTVSRHAERLLDFIERACAAIDVDVPALAIAVVPDDERALLLETWNATDAPYPEHECLHQLVEAQVERTPNGTAVISGDEHVSYAELNARANRLARHLIGLGVAPDARVAVCLERSSAMVVALLAVLKAGGAYVPLDPAYPNARLAHIVTDAAPAVVLVDQRGRQALCESVGDDRFGQVTVVDVDTDPAASPWARQPDSNLDPHALGLTSRHLAYVIYTSGSTGMPKGAQNEHRALINRLTWMQAAYGLDTHDVVLQKTPFSFDVSVWEFFWTLAYGAALVMAEPGAHRDADYLTDIVQRHQVTTLHFVPSMLIGFLDAPGVGRCSSLVRIVCSGEALPAATARRCQALLPEAQLHNLYGPTEAAIDVTAWTCPVGFDGDVVPIGKPIANTRLYVLDEHHAPVPIGAVGELYIGGVGVARGYLNRPELTAQRFLPDPFARAAGSGNADADADADADARMYRTGDLARYLPDGNLLFLGRNDDQVKIRGFRIELGEIEAQLATYDAVREAVVVARHDASGEARLLAYVTVREDKRTRVPNADLAQHLRAHLAERLPEYMLPAAFVVLDAMPLTANGKLDRRALPEPDDQAFAQAQYEAPQGDLETALAPLWCELLSLTRVGRHDNFFSLGGHSLLAVRLLNRLRASHAVELPLSALFEHPTISALAQAIGEQRARKGPSALPPITRASRDEPLQLSFAQQRLWFLNEFEGASTTYHVPLMLRLHGALDIAAWRDALDLMWVRHEALRTVFRAADDGSGAPLAHLLAAERGMPWRQDDVSSLPDALEYLQRLCEEEAAAPFALSRGPLVRARLIRVTQDEYVFMLTQHHIVCDGWSIRVLIKELCTLYRALTDDLAPALPDLDIQYPDYVAWQRQCLSAERLASEARYWREALAGIPTLLTLPTDHPRPSHQTFDAARLALEIDQPLTQALRHLAAEHGVTLFMVFAAAWAVVLARLSGQDDLVIGTPTANRPRPELEPLAGLFLNTLALRIDLSGEPSFTQLLARVRTTVLAAHEHQNLPFEQVVDIVQPPRRLDHTPVFQVMLAWQELDIGPLDLPGLRLEPISGTLDRAKFDLELDLADDGSTITGALRYASALFDADTIARHCAYLLAILRAIAGEMHRPVGRIDLLGADERRLLIETWNATDAPYPEHLCIHELVEAQAQRTPEAIALISGDVRLSYAELNARANRLARYLLDLGIPPEARVAVCLERSPAMIVALLAILKAGGAYVPLDPAYPSARLAHILIDAAPAVVFVDQAGRHALGELLSQSDEVTAGFTLIDLDAHASAWAAQPAGNIGPHTLRLTSQHLAYVIYTSGSTGTPKGVMVEHRQLANLVTWHIARFHLRPGCQVPSAAGLAFDACTWEIWPTLTSGATLLLAPADCALDSAALLQWWRKQSMETAFLVTPLALLAMDASLPDRLQHLLIGGDRVTNLPAGLPPSLQIVNNYGPTETTVVATSGVITPGEAVHTIGKPIANTRLYVLDEHHTPVPIGAVGELYIGGAGVARGYLNRPELTAQRFLPDPFARATGSGNANADARMYRTGDLARYLPDGNLLFLGRNDDQVKIRGFRIELGEIEAQLATYDAVREAVVTARHDAGGQPRLLAYVTVREDACTSEPDTHAELVQRLRAHLAERLPDYMLPAAFIVLDAMPLTVNGKLDRRALPEPDDQAFAQTHTQYEAPQGEIETALARLWCELLTLDRVGRHDNFFSLGGHSLLAARMLTQLRTTLGHEVSIRTLFEAPTIAQLAPRLNTASSSDALAMLLPIQPRGAGTPLFCIHPGGGFSWPYAGLIPYLPDRPLFGLQARALTEASERTPTIEEMARDYLEQIRSVQPGGPYRLLGWSLGCHIGHAIATQLQADGEEVEQLIMLDGYPLSRTEAFSEPTDEQVMEVLVRALTESPHTELGDGTLTIETLKAGLGQSHPLLSSPRERTLEAVFEQFKQAPALACTFSPKVFRGDVLFFRAALSQSDEYPWRKPGAWQPYVEGKIVVHDVACLHETMMRTEPLKEIGPRLAAAIGGQIVVPSAERSPGLVAYRGGDVRQ